MKKLTFVLWLAVGICLASCQDPAKSRVYMDEGVKLMMNYSKFEEAEEAFDKAIKYDKSNHEAYYYRGCTKFNRALYKEAIPDFEKALEVKPCYADAEFSLGKTYFILNDLDMACFYFKAADRDGRPNMDDYLKSCPD